MVRTATPADAREITRLRRLMFTAMGLDCDVAAWEEACVEWFERNLGPGGVGDVVGVVVDAPDGSARLVACGVIELSRSIPSPRSPRGTSAYISTISTEPTWRRRGMAAAIMDALLTVARARGVDNVDLHATEAGRPLYERLGFVERPGAPALRLSLVDPPRTAAATAH